ncbi:TPA: gfo/Idh/MocA family oxidoreductase, partial [Candidatus Poribacteria bacterium]|nr:gfo/Idh/MocA family oxidoreductase [Candidatus Poribacteria bacterium]
MKEIKVGIIGAGGIACSVHIPNYQKIENVRVIAVADIKAEVAENAAEQFNISNVFTDWEDLL